MILGDLKKGKTDILEAATVILFCLFLNTYSGNHKSDDI